MKPEQFGYKIDSKQDESDSESVKNEDMDYLSDEELKNGYMFIQKKRKKRDITSDTKILVEESYVSE
jgi:hypothetical protein